MHVPRRKFLIQSTGALTATGLGLGACSTTPNLSSAQAPNLTSNTNQPANGSQQSTRIGAGSRPAKIALLTSMAGMSRASQVSRAIKQGAELALFEANNPSIELVTKEDHATPRGAVAAGEAAAQESARIILGPLFASSAAALQPLAARTQMPVLSFSNDPTAAGSGVYLMGFMPDGEVERIVQHASRNGYRQFAALIPRSAYGRTVEPAFRQSVAQSGGMIVHLLEFDDNADGLKQAARAIAQTLGDPSGGTRKANALFAPIDPTLLMAASDELAKVGVGSNVKLLGSAIWDLPANQRNPVLRNAWYASSEPAAWTEFVAKYQKSFGQQPHRLATIGYDAMRIAMVLTTNPDVNSLSRESLTRSGGFAGIDGLIRLRPDGTNERALAMLEIDSNLATRVLEPATQVFPTSDLSTATVASR